MKQTLTTLALASVAQAAVTPVFSSAQVLGLVQDPTINRDSCAAAKFGDRALWTCRDSQPFDANGIPTLPLWSNSASWTDFNADGTPELQIFDQPDSGNVTGLLMYGVNTETPFLPLPADRCGDNTAGACADGTRYVSWPDSPPLVTSTDADGSVLAYTWLKNGHITNSLGNLDPDGPTTLYRITYTPSADDTVLPEVVMVAEEFFPEGGFSYGHYGNLVQNDVVYLYGQNSNLTVGLAKVPVDSVEDITAYEYFVDGEWTATYPALNDTGINIPNASAGGQGTYYYSEYWGSYVWIGQSSPSVSAQFYITTAPAPEGPWIAPFHFYSGVDGNFFLSSYSLQAEPALLPDTSSNQMYISYTKNDLVDNVNVYTTPLILIEWE